MTFISRLRSRISTESGFTMIIALGVLLVASLLMTAAFVAAEGDTHLTAHDTLAKKAYYAAQAGISDYLYHLTADDNYLTYCTSPTPANPALNQISEGTTHQADVPSNNGTPSGEKYAIDLLPAEDSTESPKKCNTSNIVGSMIEQAGQAEGSFRIESTGFASGVARSIVATIKNLNFLSFVWYDVYETIDPVIYGEPPHGEPEHWNECGQFYGKRPGYCLNNFFISGESVNGPMHTEDHAGICGNPSFGRTGSDRIEFGSEGFEKESGTGYSNEGNSCTSEPKFVGTHIAPSQVKSLLPPPGDEELEHVVTPEYHFYGKTEVILKGTTMTIIEHKGAANEKTKTNVAFPENGVIYVSEGCAETYSPFGPFPSYTGDSSCGNVYVHGEYSDSLTIASANDVVINGNITTPVNGETPTSAALLGLIANNFVRVWHPVSGTREKSYTKCGTAKDAAEDISSYTIYAAILAVKHSFIVDNFDCGAPLTSLKLYGALGGKFSNGATGVFSGTTAVTGYPYNLIYDNRLEVSEPPHFLNPIQAAWYIQRETLAPTL